MNTRVQYVWFSGAGRILGDGDCAILAMEMPEKLPDGINRHYYMERSSKLLIGSGVETGRTVDRSGQGDLLGL